MRNYQVRTAIARWLVVAIAWGALMACGRSPSPDPASSAAPAAKVAAPIAATAVSALSEADRAAAALPEEELPELPEKPTRALPDGVFVGAAREIEGSLIEIVVRSGEVTEARYVGPTADEKPILLSGRGNPDADALALTGRNDRDYVQIRGSFVDAERVMGTYTGGLARKVVEGEWYAVRR
ncbi:MAG: hypothetical protein R3F39_19755 [Myxococcota bacterium]